jgi:cytochrome c biogenesis protein CcdA
VFQVLLVVLGIAFADSLNPATIGPGVVLALSERPTGRLLEFTAGAFVVNVLGGILLVLGPGHWLLGLLPTLSRHVGHIAEVAGGSALVVGDALLWFFHKRLEAREMPGGRARGRSAFVAGATITFVELPTAFPYFAAIAAISGAELPVSEEVLLIVLFNVVFLAPLVALAAVTRLTSASAITPAAEWVRRHWARVLAATLTVLGTAIAAAGVIGLRGE